MAEVFLARAIGLGGFARHVVIKRIRVENGTDQKSIDMFLDEARLVASLHHRNIVQVHDVGEEDSKYFFVMEYVHGRDTRELLRHVKDAKQQVPLEHVITIVTAAAAGLHYAHEQRGADRKPLQIVHRDISPGNILVAFDGGVKVVDFGIAKTEDRSWDTQAGEMKGKVGYMSPEQCRTLPLDRRTDVFLLGIVLYELCTVRRLFKADNRFETMSQIVEGAVPLPSKFRKDIPAELERIMLKALAKAPEDRFQTADEMRLALEAFAKSAGLTISPNALSDYMKQQFGEVPEPWLVGEAVPPPSPEIMERIRSSSQLIAIQRPSQPVVETSKPESVAEPAPVKSALDTKSTQPELEAIKAAKPVIAGAPAGPDPDLEPTIETPPATPVVQPATPQAPAAPAVVQPRPRQYPTGPTTYPIAPSSTPGWLLWAIGALVLVGGGVALYWFVIRPEPAPQPAAVSEQPAPIVQPALPPPTALDAAVAPVAATETAAVAAPSDATPDIPAAAIDAGAPAAIAPAPARTKPLRPKPRPAQPPKADPKPAPPVETDTPAESPAADKPSEPPP